MRPGWEYDPYKHVWLYGTPGHGCGVRRNGKGVWRATVIQHGRASWLDEEFETAVAAMKAAERALGEYDEG